MKKLLRCVVMMIVVCCFMNWNAGLGFAAQEDVNFDRDRAIAQAAASERFDIRVYPARITAQEDGYKVIRYNLSVENKSDIRYEDLSIALKLNGALEQYLVVGILITSSGTIDLAAINATTFEGEDSRGIYIGCSKYLCPDLELAEAGLDYRDVIDLGKTFEVRLKWRGGEEIFLAETVVIDEMGL